MDFHPARGQQVGLRGLMSPSVARHPDLDLNLFLSKQACMSVYLD